MPHVVERAATGRAKCRGCGAPITKDAWRVGEAVPNLYADADGAESRHWYHTSCAAYRRPEAFVAAIESADVTVEEQGRLLDVARQGVAHHRLPRVDRAERASSGRAACRSCRAPITKGAWRIALLFWQDGRFAPAGFIHAACAQSYLGTPTILERVRHFTPGLTTADEAELAAAIASPAAVTEAASADPTDP